MPLERIADGSTFDIFLGFVYGGKIKISIGIKEGNFSFNGLFDLIEMYLDDWQRMVNCKIERFSCSDLIEFDHFRISRFYNCYDIRRDGNFLLAHEFN